LFIGLGPASSISDIFKTRTCSVIYKNLDRKEERIGQQVKWFRLPLENMGDLGRDETVSLLYLLQCAYSFSKSNKRSL